MLTVLTGADGFVGRALARRMRSTDYPGVVRLVDRTLAPAHGFEAIACDLTDPAARKAALANADRIIHLAALPGGAAEADPALSRAINLDLTLDILAMLPTGVSLVHASSIAVFGTPASAIDDDSPAYPTSVYGAHKQMAEIAIADAARRGLPTLSIRLPGTVARPDIGDGFKSAFMSQVFNAFLNRTPIGLPVAPDATMWLLSADGAAEALLHTAKIPKPERAVLTLPALRVTMVHLVAALSRATGSDAALARYLPDAAIMDAFGRLPALSTVAADRLGFRHDGDLDTLVARALAGLKSA